MKLRACKYEKETAELLARGAWPVASSPELLDHVDCCRSCSDLVAVTKMLQQARRDAVEAAPAGSPGALWWRAQLRRRNAAMERLNRPQLGAEFFALAMLCAVPVAMIALGVKQNAQWLDWFEGLPQSVCLYLEELWLGWSPYLWISACALLALFGGVAVYLATEKR